MTKPDKQSLKEGQRPKYHKSRPNEGINIVIERLIAKLALEYIMKRIQTKSVGEAKSEVHAKKQGNKI